MAAEGSSPTTDLDRAGRTTIVQASSWGSYSVGDVRGCRSAVGWLEMGKKRDGGERGKREKMGQEEKI